MRASQERCFDLARDVDVHCKTAAFTEESAIPPGRLSGMLELGDSVVFEAKHLGVRQRLGARIVSMEPPERFSDEMTFGIFDHFFHTHEFVQSEGGTLVRDILEWRSPLGLLGLVADALIVKRHLRRFLERRNENFKAFAEDPGESLS